MRATVAAADPARKYHIADRLFFKLQGATPGALSESVVVVKKIVRKHGGDKFRPAKTQEEAEDGPEEWVVHRSGVCRRGSKDLNDRRMVRQPILNPSPRPPRAGACERAFYPKSYFCARGFSPYRCSPLDIYSVPIFRLPQLVYEPQQDIEASGILFTVVGHTGDGE